MICRSTSMALAIVTGLIVSQTAVSHEFKFFTRMDGLSENPTNDSNGKGKSLVTIDADLLTMRVEFDFRDLTGTTTLSHIHCCVAPPGNVGVATVLPTFNFPIGVTSGSFDQTFDMTSAASYNPAFVTANNGSVSDAFQALFNALSESDPAEPQAYLNIHTSFRAGGEIRGFFVLVPEPVGGLMAILGFGAPMCAAWRRSRS